MLKIALTGAHGTGKTTLIRQLPSILSSLGKINICREAPRLIIDLVKDAEYFRRGNNTPQRQALIFAQHLLEERQQINGADVIITDRTLVDHLAYTSVLFPEFLNTSEYKVYKYLAITSLTSYDLLCKLPIEFPVEDDGVREGAVEFQREIDRAIDNLYAEADIAPNVISGSVDARLSEIQRLALH